MVGVGGEEKVMGDEGLVLDVEMEEGGKVVV